MGQSISYPPLDVVIYLAKFLWFDDIHAFTTVSHAINDMIESESDLWRSLMHSSIQRVLAIPFSLHFERPDPALTKMLIRRTCDHPCVVDTHILLKHKGPDNVIVVESTQKKDTNITINFQQPPGDSYHPNAPTAMTRRTVVSNTHFPCVTNSINPRALVPFTKVMAVGRCKQQRKTHNVNSPVHIASLSTVAYFEGTLLPTPNGEDKFSKVVSMSSIGIACAPSITRSKLPGEDSFSFGYSSTNGQTMMAGVRHNAQCESYSDGDTVGCGVIYPLKDTSGYVFFTKNGTLQTKIKILNPDIFFSIAWFPAMVFL